MKSFLVIGLGRFGTSLACELCALGHEVMAVDLREERVQEVAGSVTHAAAGDARDPEVLRALGARNFDCAVVSAGDDVGTSALIVLNLKELGVPQVVGKARSAVHHRVLEKIGADKVRAELAEYGVAGDTADKILAFIGIGGSNDEVLAALRALDCDDATFREGVEELDKVVHYAYLYGIPEKNITIDLTIARGLDYYTGTVYETKLVDYPTLGSVCSGGRYDNLTGYYTDDHMPGIGISIGLTRLFSQLRAAEIITDTKKSLCDVLFVPTDKAHMAFVLGSAAEMRAAGLNVDVYCLDKGMKPKMKFANRSGIPYVALVGEDEAAAGKLTLKNMETGEQELLDVYAAIEKINK